MRGMACCWVWLLLVAPAQPPDHRALQREILRELIEIDTSDGSGRTGDAARAMARRLVDAGMPEQDVRVIGVTEGVENLIARYRGTDPAARPILLMAHIDVVGASRDDWSFEPFEFRELDGYYYGRGTTDNKAGAAMLVANFIRYRQEGFRPARDLVVVLTGDEETTGDSIRLILEKHRDLVDAEYALNTDAGGGELRDGRPSSFGVQTAEKIYVTFAIEARHKGGHSSLPEPDNAIYRLSEALLRLSRFAFPVRLNDTTRTSLERTAANAPPDRARDMRALAATGDAAAAERLSRIPAFNSLLRTTCVATQVTGGHAENALPQLARATINCRLLPDDSADAVEAALKKAVADDAIAWTRVWDAMPSPASPLRPDVMAPVETLAQKMWPGVVVAPSMSTGATDGAYTRNAGIPTYGVGALFSPIDDKRAHGRDERVGVRTFHEAAEFWYELVKTLSVVRR